MGEVTDEYQHLVTINLDGGWPMATMTCPFDAADPERPCWPWDLDKEEPCGQDEGERCGCNWKEWFDQSGGLESVHKSPLIVLPVERALWEGDFYHFTLGDPLRQVGGF